MSVIRDLVHVANWRDVPFYRWTDDRRTGVVWCVSCDHSISPARCVEHAYRHTGKPLARCLTCNREYFRFADIIKHDCPRGEAKIVDLTGIEPRARHSLQMIRTVRWEPCEAIQRHAQEHT